MNRTGTLLLVIVALRARAAVANEHLYVLAIGNNQPPFKTIPNESSPEPAEGVRTARDALGWAKPTLGPGESAAATRAEQQAPLRYADDDAAALFRFLRPFARAAILLTEMDADTARRYPEEAALARPPSIGELRAAVGGLRTALASDTDRSSASVLIFYSGHGGRNASVPYLALADELFTRELLYEEVLAALPARFIHLFVDACYAEGVVRPRDVDADATALTGAALVTYENARTLARFPNVGTIVASTGAAQTHEWDSIGHGVFTEELLSGLRGGADVNHDGKIEYSELHAFLTAANREVRDARARLGVITRAPLLDQRTPILQLSTDDSGARLIDIPGAAGHVFVEDDLGNRLADVHSEVGTNASLLLPAKTPLYVHARAGEARVTIRSGGTVAFADLTIAAPAARARGSMSDAIAHGVFAAPFGANYYRGFIDRSPEVIPVAFVDSPSADSSAGATASVTATTHGPVAEVNAARSRYRVFWGAGAARAVANDIQAMVGARVGYAPGNLPWLTLGAELDRGSATTISEWRALASGEVTGTIVQLGAASALIGVQTSVGMAWQSVKDNPIRMSAAANIGPRAHLRYAIGSHFGLDLAGGAPLLLYRRDGRTAGVVSPDAFLSVVTRL